MIDFAELKEFTDEEYDKFCKFVYDIVGINLTEKKKSLVHNRLRKRVIENNLNSYGDYFKLIKTHHKEDEIVSLLNSITTNVTSFFRDPKQFYTLSQLVIPEFENEKRKITLWSAGCSTGEEPYSIALELLKYSARLDFEIIASDISTRALDYAKAGLYSYDQVKTIEPRFLSKFFIKDGENYKIGQELKRYIIFKKLNLMSDVFPNRVDIIFCRNVIIYFDKATKDNLFAKFHKILNKNGFLFLGHSESIFNNPLFRFYKPSVYIKTEVG